MLIKNTWRYKTLHYRNVSSEISNTRDFTVAGIANTADFSE